MMRNIVAVLLLLGGVASAADSALKVTVPELLAAPEKFAGRRVDVTGYYVAINEDSDLYASERATHGDLDQSIWIPPELWDPRLHPHRPSGIARADRVDNRTVRVIGTFHYQPHPDLGKSVPYEHCYQGFGSYSLSKYAILDITYIQPVR